MNEQEVIDAIKLLQKYQMETAEIEAKTAEKDVPKKCYDTISAFANTRGGIISNRKVGISNPNIRSVFYSSRFIITRLLTLWYFIDFHC